MLVRVHARRFSSATAAATANEPLAKVKRFFEPQPIEEIVEMKTLESVQRLTEQLCNNAKPVAIGNEGSIRDWFRRYQQEKNLKALDKAGFEQLMKDAATHISTTEATLLANMPPIAASTMEGSEKHIQDAYVDALKLKLLSHKCHHVAANFDHADEDRDGTITAHELERLVTKVIDGTNDDWIRYQFELRDTDADELVNEAESKQILDSIVLLQKTVLTDLFATRVANLPKKKPMKMFEAAVDETNWKEKIPEKIRCVFHYAPKEDEEKKLVHWEAFKESQEAELSELNEMLRVYAKGVYNERYTFYERKQEARSRRLKGVALAIALSVGDYIFALV